MSKNILELLENKIKTYDKNEKSCRIKVPRSLISKKVGFARTLIMGIFMYAEVYKKVDKDSPYQKFTDEFERDYIKIGSKQIGKLHKDLFKNIYMKDVPIKNIIEDDIESILEMLYRAEHTINFIRFKKKTWKKSELIQDIRKEFNNNIDSFLSENYEAPESMVDVHQQILSICAFYYLLYIIEIPPTMLSTIDLAVANLSFVAAQHICLIYDKGIVKFRIDRGTSRKRKIKAAKKQHVLETYYKIDKTGMKPHKIATTIKEILGNWQQDPPSVDTIKRYLKGEKLI